MCGCSVQRNLKNQTPRWVPPFSVQTLQKGTTVTPFKCQRDDQYLTGKQKVTLFRIHFNRGDLPIAKPCSKQMNPKMMLHWRIFPRDLDYAHYLPIFFEGLAETKFPYNYYARAGIHDMLEVGGDKIFPVIPQLILPIKNALRTKDPDAVLATLAATRHLLFVGKTSKVGLALVPYYNHLLFMLNILRKPQIMTSYSNVIEPKQKKNLNDEIETTLQMLERYGGPDAFINIKCVIPTYESCVMRM